MYRSCIFCSAPLGSNESIERFPVGRSLAFDGEKGRLWAVCPRCARWNLAPIEERWEAIEDAERLFHDARLRVQRENIGLAKLRDGTRLMRVGRALPGEFAAWRYGRELTRRQHWPRADGMVGWMVDMVRFGREGARRLREQRIPARLSPTAAPLVLRRPALEEARLAESADGTLLVRVASAEFRGQAARTVLARAMPILNREGADAWELQIAVGVMLQAPSAEAYIRTLARQGRVLGGSSLPPERLTDTGLRALEMALHEETERRALDGELTVLEGMWREAEEIAAIADRLPEIPASEPPRIGSAG